MKRRKLHAIADHHHLANAILRKQVGGAFMGQALLPIASARIVLPSFCFGQQARHPVARV
jgi:hypothetical protein